MLMIGDPFEFSHGLLADEMMVSPTGFCVTTCGSCSVRGTVQIWVLLINPLQPDKISEAIWKKYVGTSAAAVHPKERWLFTSDSTCFRHLAVSGFRMHNNNCVF